MKKIIKAGSVDQTIDVFIQDSTSTTGAGKTGLAYNTASLVCYYRKGATGAATALTLATQTVGGAHSDGGFVEIDATNMPGMYRLDLSDTIVASAGSVTMMLKGATGMAPLPIELQVTAMDLEGGVVPTLTTYTGNTPQTGDVYALANGASGFVAIKNQTAAIEVDTGTDIPATLSTIAGYIDTEIGAVKAKTDNLPVNPAATTDVPTAIQNADALLSRDLGSGTNDVVLDERTVRSAFRQIRNRWTISAGTLTVYCEDDTTVAFTAAVTGTAGADPITSTNPT